MRSNPLVLGIGIGLGLVAVGTAYHFWEERAEKARREEILNSDGVYRRKGEMFFACDNCGQRIGLTRYVCWTCDEDQQTYDLCQTCMEIHPHQTRKCKFTTHLIRDDMTCSAEKLLEIFRIYDERKCIGSRVRADGSLGDFEWISYGQIGEKARAISAYLQKTFPAGSFIGICGKNSADWYIIDYAIVLSGFISVPIYQSFNEDATRHIVEQTNMICVFTTRQESHKFLSIKQNYKKLTHVILMSDRNPEPCIPGTLQISDVLSSGLNLPFTARKRKMGQIASLRYTSGSTGMPKGTILLESHWFRDLSTFMRSGTVSVSLSFGPLAHGTQHKSSLGVLCGGGRIGIYSGDIEHLFDDVTVLKPSLLTFPPRVYNQIKAEFDQMVRLETAKNPLEDLKTIEKRVRKFIRDEMFGGRVWRIGTGGAPTSPEITEFLKLTFGCGVSEGYGTTESGSIASDGLLQAWVDVKLVDVPELQYFSTDTPPRGELWVRSALNSPGYWNDEANTRANFSDGWVSTGDIVELDGKKVKIIDRKKAIFKLSQSEFVAPEKLEVIFLQHPMIHNCYVHGDSLRSYVLLAIVPDHKEIQQWVLTDAPHLVDLSIDELYQHSQLHQKILSDLQENLHKHQLRPFELPRGILIEKTPWTSQNGLLTESLKVSRLKLRSYYKPHMDALYDKIDQKEKAGQMLKLLTDELQFESKDTTFKELGVDSVSAIRLQSLLKSKLNVIVPITTLLDENTTIDDLVLGEKKEETVNIDWEAEWELPVDIEKRIAMLAPHFQHKPLQNAFLTGATGFLGIFLLTKLLTIIPGNIYCLARSTSTTPAKSRLQESLKYYQQWNSCEAQWHRIITVEGDLESPLFGLTEQSFTELSNSVDVIYHNGAWVNTVFPYHTLKKSNVSGTIETLRLASIGSSLIPIMYVSTVSVYRGLKNEVPLKGSEGMDMMGGYGSSKRVAEMLIQKSHGAGLPVCVFRLGTVSGDSKTGTANRTQFINRFIEGICKMGLAPNVNQTFPMIPVDHMAHVICHLSIPENYGQIFNLFNDKTSITVNQLTEYLISLGYPIKIIDFHSWRQTLSNSDTANPLHPLMSYFSFGFPFGGAYPDSNAAKAMQNLHLEWPPINKEIISHYAHFLINQQND